MAKKKSRVMSRPGNVEMLASSNPTSVTPAYNVTDRGKEATASSNCSRSLGDSDTWSESKVHVNSSQPSSCDRAKSDGLPKSGQPTAERFKLRFVEHDDVCYKVQPSGFDDISKSLGFVLIGYIAGKFPGKKAIDEKCKSWGVKYLLHFHESGWIIVKFYSEEDRTRVIDGGPYFVFDRPFILEPMPSFFNFEKREQHKVPVWVRLPGLHYGCWNPESLSGIASRLGIPLHSDRATALKEKLEYARFLVLVDISKDLCRSLPVCMPDDTVYEQRVVYECVPKLCSECKGLGHVAAKCPRSKPRTVEPTDAVPLNAPKGNICAAERNGKTAQTDLGTGPVHIRFSEDEAGNLISCPSGIVGSKATVTRKKDKDIAPLKRDGTATTGGKKRDTSTGTDATGGFSVCETSDSRPAAPTPAPDTFLPSSKGPEDDWPPLHASRVGCSGPAVSTQAKHASKEREEDHSIEVPSTETDLGEKCLPPKVSRVGCSRLADLAQPKYAPKKHVEVHSTEEAPAENVKYWVPSMRSLRTQVEPKYDKYGMLINPNRRGKRGTGRGRGTF